MISTIPSFKGAIDYGTLAGENMTVSLKKRDEGGKAEEVKINIGDTDLYISQNRFNPELIQLRTEKSSEEGAYAEIDEEGRIIYCATSDKNNRPAVLDLTV